MDICAERIGMDPIEFRMRNLWRKGAVTATLQPVRSISGVETVQEAAALADIELPEHLKTMRTDKTVGGEAID
jgi:CO/xanthine dehydrogenase Mo-binding subunit